MISISDFCERLSYLIFENKLTIESFSKAVKIDVSVVYKYLRKESFPSLQNLVVIADYFKCSIDYLLGCSENNSKSNFKAAKPVTERLQELLKERNISRYKLRQIAKSKNYSFARQSVDDWYHGVHLPSIDNVFALAKCFDLTIDEFLGRE